MDFEQLLNRYFELDKILKDENHNLSADETVRLKAEHKILYSEFFKTFMVVRLKLGLDPDIKCHDWLKKEYDQMLQIRRLLADDL